MLLIEALQFYIHDRLFGCSATPLPIPLLDMATPARRAPLSLPLLNMTAAVHRDPLPLPRQQVEARAADTTNNSCSIYIELDSNSDSAMFGTSSEGMSSSDTTDLTHNNGHTHTVWLFTPLLDSD